MHISSNCAHCKENVKSKRRDFNEQTWAVLLVWGEVDRGAVDQPLCGGCYEELREVLIDRAGEIEVALQQPAGGQAPKISAKKAGGAEKPAARGGRKVSKMAS
jgi:hypothetical protein